MMQDALPELRDNIDVRGFGASDKKRQERSTSSVTFHTVALCAFEAEAPRETSKFEFPIARTRCTLQVQLAEN